MLSVGFGYENRADAFADGTTAALILDAKESWIGGLPQGVEPSLLVVRLYWKGRDADLDWLIRRTRFWSDRGAYVLLLNEPNHPIEQWGSDAAIFRAYDLYSRVHFFSGSDRLVWCPPSPGFAGWEAWYTDRDARVAIETACGNRIAAHAYGSHQQIEDCCYAIQQTTPGCRRFLTEFNFGPAEGRHVDLGTWAAGVPDLLSWLDGQGWDTALYYQWQERHPDYPHETPVDAKGTPIETAIRAWRPSAQPAPPPEPPQEATMIRGIDVSNNQGKIDWGAVWASGVAFAAIKASGDETDSGRFVDLFFAENWREAGDRGLVRIAYHYGCPSRTSPAQSVTLLQEQVETVGGLLPGDLIALDLEDPAVPAGQSLLAWTAEWLDLAERVFGFPPLLYSGDYYLGEHGLHNEALGRYPLWLAAWQATPPPVPEGWPRVTLWQHSSSGRTPGVQGNCDLNRFEGTAAELRALGKPGAAVEPATPMPASPILAVVDAMRRELDTVRCQLDELERLVKEAA